MSKVYVVCPGGYATGGIELLHQLVSTLNDNGVDSSIIYSPFNVDFEVNPAYKKYNIKQVRFSDTDFTSEDRVVLPEVYTGYKGYFSSASVYIWWLSVDNYFDTQPQGIDKLKQIIKRIVKHKRAIPKPISIKKLGRCKHLTQSFYAEQFLSEFGFSSVMLSDYLNQEHLNKNVDLTSKFEIICYNPNKGANYTNLLKNKLSEYKFVAIENMSATEVSQLLDSAMIYIDFGNHPGKDRIPREAAMAGCVVITGLQGSASNHIDIPVDQKYKIDENSKDFEEKVGTLIKDVFRDFSASSCDFDDYRKKIKSEKSNFIKEAISIFK